MSALELEGRAAIPDELAFLRSSYPREDWRGHANFGQLSDFWLHVHDHLREQGTRIEQATSSFREGRLDARSYAQFLAQALNQFFQHLNGHHQIEDHHYFPKFRSLDPRMVAGFELLDRDHHRIHESLLASAKAANDFLASFEKGGDAVARAGEAYAESSSRLQLLLKRHLADEEDLVLPALLHYGEGRLG